MLASIMNRFRDPATWADASQVLKTTLAVVVSWVLAVHVFDLAQGFMAPWAALLTLQATVYGTFRRGLQQAAATVAGVLIAYLSSRLFGLGGVALGVAVLAGLLIGSLRRLRAETTTAAATAIIVLTTGYVDQGSVLATRLIDTGIGIAVGLLVNLLVWPPLRDRAAAHEIDEIDDDLGALLRRIAAELREGRGAECAVDWIERSRELDADIKRAGRLLDQARESGHFNPRRAARPRMQATEDFGRILSRLEQGVAETRSMARTVQLSDAAPANWDPAFRRGWIELVDRLGAAVEAADGEGIRRSRTAVADFADQRAIREAGDGLWPVYGALLVNLRNVGDALDPVAEAQPVHVPPPSLPSRRGRSPAGTLG
jgi:uncharacterized membrane protein YgaE (UPF0421/DUF939 family)